MHPQVKNLAGLRAELEAEAANLRSQVAESKGREAAAPGISAQGEDAPDHAGEIGTRPARP